MSRIYEALQRADRERNAASVAEDRQILEPVVLPTVDVPPPVEDEAPLPAAAQFMAADPLPAVTQASVAPQIPAAAPIPVAAQIPAAAQIPVAARIPPAAAQIPVAARIPAPAPLPAAARAVAGQSARQFNEQAWRPSLAFLPTLAERGIGVEQFRGLRSRIFQARYEMPLKTILVSSGMPAEGKSFLAANLAMCLAHNTDNNILLIDGDLRRPTLHNFLGAPNTPGLAEYLAGTASAQEVMQRDAGSKNAGQASETGLPNLTFIAAGDCGDNSSELIANHRTEELIASVSSNFDWIVIDSPPVLAVTDALELARAADAVLLVAQEARTPFEVAQRTQAAFANSRVLGYVLNNVKEAPRRGSYSYYGYYGSSKNGGAGKKTKEREK